MSDVKIGDILKNKYWAINFHIECSFDMVRKICGTVPVCLETPCEADDEVVEKCCRGHVTMIKNPDSDNESAILLDEKDLEKAAIVSDQTKTDRMKN